MRHRFTEQQCKNLVSRYKLASDRGVYTVSEEVLISLLQAAFLRGAALDVMHTQAKEKR